MRVVLVAALVFSAAGQSAPVRTIKDGALDEIKLYVETLPPVTSRNSWTRGPGRS